MRTKFTKQLESLVIEEVISPAIANRISEYYAEKQTSKSIKLFTIFGVFGALLVGAGMILMIAHNWDNISRGIKTVCAFIPLVTGQLFVGYSILKNKNKSWREASGTFLCFAVVGCISLVSQVYHIPGQLSSFLLSWILLSLPIVYLLRSQVVAILMIVIATYYAIEVGYWEYNNRESPWMYIVFLVALLPFYWGLLRKRVLSNGVTFFNWIFPLSIALCLGTFINENGELGFLMYITLFGMYYATGKLPIFKQTKPLRNGFLVTGSLGLVTSLLICTFRWPWKQILDNWMFASQEFYVALVFANITILLTAFLVIKRGIGFLNLFQTSFVVFWLLFFLFPQNDVVPVIITNLLVFAMGLYTIRTGINDLNLGTLNYGLIIISILIVCRFFDTNISFVLRGILFMLVGTGFFLANYSMFKKMSKRSNDMVSK